MLAGVEPEVLWKDESFFCFCFERRQTFLYVYMCVLLSALLLYWAEYVLQAGDKQFNRGKLMNIGYLEALKFDKFDCFVFQDADLLPETDKNLYMCDPHARHLASAINEMRYQ